MRMCGVHAAKSDKDKESTLKFVLTFFFFFNIGISKKKNVSIDLSVPTFLHHFHKLFTSPAPTYR